MNGIFSPSGILSGSSCLQGHSCRNWDYYDRVRALNGDVVILGCLVLHCSNTIPSPGSILLLFLPFLVSPDLTLSSSTKIALSSLFSSSTNTKSPVSPNATAPASSNKTPIANSAVSSMLRQSYVPPLRA